MPPDRIFVRGLVLHTAIGVHAYERPIRQTLVVDLEFEMDLAPAAESDALGDTVDYRALCEKIQARVEAGRYGLIERVAEEIARLVLEEPAVRLVRVVLEKPGAVRRTRTVGVVLERRRDG
jgi:dihydroneopterin aldolase